MKITTNKQAAIDPRGGVILTGTIEEIDLNMLRDTIWQGIKFMKDEISRTECKERKTWLSYRVEESDKIHQNLLEATSRAMKAGLMKDITGKKSQ
jgi:ABC-type Fe3+-citrate transport system substrate-binding protein